MAKKEPKQLTFEEFADELLAERQARALVILAAAKIDLQLRGLLEAFMWQKAAKANDEDELLDGQGALSRFSCRINACRRLGLIDSNVAKVLHQFRDIRNSAAHWISFGVHESPLRDQIKNLEASITKWRPYALTVNSFFGSANLSAFETFQAMLLTIAAILEATQGTIAGRSLRNVPVKPLTK